MIELPSREWDALLNWAGVDLKKCLGTDGTPNALVVAGSSRNAIRAAEQYGPKLVAMLAAKGLIDDGESPVDALERLLES